MNTARKAPIVEIAVTNVVGATNMIDSSSTLPKPFVFVLMPFDQTFDDIYKFGIKGAADDVGAYAERIDEQIFSEGILDRIFNQISKADVVVADMTGRNPNVFYEVGYAHALGKIVVLLTQNADDIPFDLKHKQHTVYGGKIELLRKELAAKLQWAIAEAKGRAGSVSFTRVSLRVLGIEVPAVSSSSEIVKIVGTVNATTSRLPVYIRNDSLETLREITHVYLFTSDDAKFLPATLGTKLVPLKSFTANSVDASDGLSKQFRLAASVSALPPGAVEEISIPFMFAGDTTDSTSNIRLRFHTGVQYHDFAFALRIRLESVDTQEEAKTKIT
jgi:hypothetical protein